MRKLAITLSIILALPMSLVSIPANASVTVTICDPSAANWGGGTGTSSDPYLVCSKSHLENLGSATTGQHVKLARSIDLGGLSSPWTPIATFSGEFDGNFNSISGLYITGDRLLFGLFEKVLNGASFKNLRIDDPVIVSTYSGTGDAHAGVLAAGAVSSPTFENIYVSNLSITGPLRYAGGLIGSWIDTLSAVVVNNVHVVGASVQPSLVADGSDPYIGGIIGRGSIAGVRIQVDMSATGNKNGDLIGGVIGYNGNGQSSTLSEVDVTVDFNGTAEPCTTGGSCISFVGGVAGNGVSVSASNVFIGGSFQDTEDFDSNSRLSGMFGYSESNASKVVVVADMGTKFGSTNEPISSYTTTANPADVFYDQDVISGYTSSSVYGTGKSTSDLQTITTFSNGGFDIVAQAPSDWSLDEPSDPIWEIAEGSYPQQIWVEVSAARFAAVVERTEELYIYPEEGEIIELSSLEADGGEIFLVNFDTSVLTTQSLNSGTDTRVDVVSSPSTAGSLLTSFDANFKKAGVNQKVTFNVNVSDKDLSPAVATLPTDVTAAVGSTLWASAYERYLDTSVLVDGLETSRVDEYVYRITTEENVDSDSETSVDLQSLDGYDFLTQGDQDQWYLDTYGLNYRFDWAVFACVGTSEDDVVAATNLRTEYASLENMVTASVVDDELNADFRQLSEYWSASSEPARTVVGLSNSSNIVGEWTRGAPLASLKVVGDCESGYNFDTLPVLENGSLAFEKSLELTESLSVEGRDTRAEVTLDPVGLTIGVTGGGPSYSQALWGLTTISAAPSTGGGFSSPSPFQGPVITDVGGDNQIADFNAAVGDSVTIEGSNLDSVTSVTVGGVEAEVVSTDDSRVSFVVPAGLELGAQELVVIAAGQSIRVQEQIVITSTNVQSAASCIGQEPNLWTKRVSDTEAKVYIKCGTPGVSYRIDVQQNGGDYETLITRTLVDENDDRQVFNSVGRYIVRTIDLESKTRIRIFADDEKQWQVVYNQR